MEPSCDRIKPPITIAIPTMLWNSNFSCNSKKEMKAVMTGIRFVNMLARTAPNFRTPLVYSKKARSQKLVGAYCIRPQ